MKRWTKATPAIAALLAAGCNTTPEPQPVTPPSDSRIVISRTIHGKGYRAIRQNLKDAQEEIRGIANDACRENADAQAHGLLGDISGAGQHVKTYYDCVDYKAVER